MKSQHLFVWRWLSTLGICQRPGNPASTTGPPHLNPPHSQTPPLPQAQHQPRTPPGTSLDTRPMPKSGVRGRGLSGSPSAVQQTKGPNLGKPTLRRIVREHNSFLNTLLGTTSSCGGLSKDGGVPRAHTARLTEGSRSRRGAVRAPTTHRTSPFEVPLGGSEPLIPAQEERSTGCP